MAPIPLILGLSLLTVVAVAHPTPRRYLEVSQSEGLDFPYITYSDDGRKLELTPFLLDVFETDGDLPTESVSVVQSMTNQFLITELNKIFPSDFPLEFVNITVVAQSRVFLEETRRKLSRRERMMQELSHGSLETKEEETSYLRQRQNLDEKVGSALEVTIDVIFDRSPSPGVQEVNEKVKMVMKDLSMLPSNLTSSNDSILADIYLIRRREIPTLTPTFLPSASPSAKVAGGAGTDGGDGTSGATGYNPEPINRSGSQDDSKIGIISGSLVAAAAIVLLVFYFAVRNRRREDEEESEQKEMFLQIGSDVESSMGSPSSTPRGSIGGSIETPSSATGSYGKSAADSIFSGISDGESPRHRSLQSKKSMSSQTTVQASGKGPAITPTSLCSPSSLQMIGSLFVFEEASFEDEEEASPGIRSTPRGTSIEPSPDTPSQLIAQSTPATDVAIVNGQKPVTPLPLLLQPKTPVTDAAVDMSLMGMAHHDAAIRDLVYEGTEVGILETSVKRNLAESSAYGLPPKSPVSKRSQASPTKNQLSSNNFGSEDDMDENLPHNWDPLESNHNALMMAGGAVLATGTAAAIATRRNSSSPVASPKTQSGAAASPILASPKKNKYTGLAATGKSPKPSPGVADKKSKYKELLTNLSPKGWKREATAPVTASSPGADDEPEYEVDPGGSFPTFQNESPIARHRRHAGYKGKGDGAADYQNGAMHPLDWSNKDDSSIEGSSLSSHREAKQARKFFFAQQNTEILGNTSPALDPLTPNSNMSTLSGNTNGSNEGASHVSASQQLIQDLVWLEQKIASGKALSSSGAPSIAPTSPSVIEAMDSLSYVSGDQVISPSSNEGSTRDTGSPIMQSIICRDCFAPPGKLQIVIHSTKDGPAVHTVKKGSSLEGHMFPGDLIIAVDNVDTRTYSAEAVMKMMAEKHACERKITVLHFED